MKYLVKFKLDSNHEVGSYEGSKVVDDVDNFSLSDEEIEDITGFSAFFFRTIILEVKEVVSKKKGNNRQDKKQHDTAARSLEYLHQWFEIERLSNGGNIHGDLVLADKFGVLVKCAQCLEEKELWEGEK